jgi:hypothetical protein
VNLKARATARANARMIKLISPGYTEKKTKTTACAKEININGKEKEKRYIYMQKKKTDFCKLFLRANSDFKDNDDINGDTAI